MFLQEGFASHKVGDKAFTWVYRKDRPAFNTNIINVGVEGLFYTQEQDTLVDDLITKAEAPLSGLVEALKNSGPGDISDSRIPELIAHLEFRTRHLRQVVLQTGGYLVSRLVDFLADQEAFIRYLERKFRNDPSIIRKPLSEELAKQALPQSMLEPMMEMADPFIPIFMAQLKPILPKMAVELRSSLPGKLNEAVKSGHISALKQTSPPQVRIQRYKNLAYSILSIQDDKLILGDSAVLFRVEGAKPYKVLLEKGDVLSAVFLPLSPGSALVGSRENFFPFAPDLRQAIARCSLEYFIAHKNCDENNHLKEQIGEDAYLLTKEQMEEIIAELINK
jgi:hypothetical protein